MPQPPKELPTRGTLYTTPRPGTASWTASNKDQQEEKDQQPMFHLAAGEEGVVWLATTLLVKDSAELSL